MLKKSICLLLVLLLSLSCFSSTVFAAQLDIQTSALTTNSFSCAAGDFLDIVFYIDAASNVQGFNGTIKTKSGLSYTADNVYEVNSSIKTVTPYVNQTGSLEYNFSLLFNPNGGQTFSKKTELIRFHTKADSALSSQTLVYTVVELFDKNYNDIASSKISCSVEKVSGSSATLTGITVTPPTNTTYYVNGSFSTAGMKVTAKYSDNSTKDVTNSVTVSQPDMSTEGTKIVTVSYGGKNATFSITVNAIAITGISVSKLPTKTSYYTNETFNSAGTEITVSYNNGTTAVVTKGLTFSSPDMSTAGTKEVTVTYSGKTAKFSITVNSIQVSSISITNKPTTLSYYTGDTFNSSGLKVTAKYNNNTTADVTNSVTISKPDMSTAGTKTVTVTYAGKTATFDITVTKLEVSSLTLISPPSKTSYYTGDTFSISGINVRATYNNNSTSNVSSELTYSAPDMSKAGTKTVTVSYGGKSTSFDITVTALAVSSIAITTKPSKVSYIVGETFSTSGMKVTATYNNNTTKDVTSSVTVSKPDMTSAGTKTVTVTFGGKSATFNITVSNATVSSIAITTKPSKVSYIVGETFSTSGMKVTATYNNNTTKDVTSSVTVSKPDMTSAGTKTVTVTFGGKSATFNITVSNATVSSIAITTKPSKVSYIVGETFSTSGMKVTATYNNNTTKDVTSSVTVSKPDMTSAGVEQVVVSFEGKNAAFEISVTPVAVTSISLSAPSKTDYYIGEVLDTTGIQVTAYYNNGTSQDVTTLANISEPDMTTAGTKTITVTYEGYNASFEITVTEVNITGLEMTKAPDKLNYYVGEAFAADGIEVIASYNNGEKRDVSSSIEFSSPDMNAAGTVSVTGSFGGYSVDFTIIVEDVTAVSLTIESLPVKTEYFVGDEFDITGINVSAGFNNSTTRDVNDSISVSQPDMYTEGEKTVVISFGGQTAEFTINIISITAVSMNIISLPTKTEYNIGESFVTDGIMISAELNNGTSQDISNMVEYSIPDMTTAGIKQVTVSYGELTADFVINVLSVSLQEIMVSSDPTKVNYYSGEVFDPAGIIVIAVFDDGTVVDVTDKVEYIIPEMSTAGTKDVGITYEGISTSVSITVNDVRAAGVTITQNPYKLNYFVGETFDPTGLTVTATFDDGSTSDVTNCVILSDPDMSSEGTKQVTVTFADLNTEFTIEVLTAEVTAISFAQLPYKVEFRLNDEFIYDGIAVQAEFTDGTTQDISSKINVLPPEMSVEGEQKVFVEFNGLCIEYTITISDLDVIGIEITSLPTKTIFITGEDFVTDGLAVAANMSDGSTKDVTYRVNITEPDMTAEGTQFVILSYNGLTTSYPITIEPNQLLSVVILQNPTKIEYFVGEIFESGGMIVTANYSDGSSIDITNNVIFSDVDMSTPGTKQVVVMYEDHQASFEIIVNELVPANLNIIELPAKRQYRIGEDFDSTGLIITVMYTNYAEENITNDVTIQLPDMSTSGNKTVILAYKGLTAEFEISVYDDSVRELNILSYPTTMTYYVNSGIDLSGLSVTAVMGDGSTSDVTAEVEVAFPDMSSAGEKQVIISYQGVSISFDISVVENNVVSVNVNPPTRSIYFIGEELDVSTMSVTAVYSDGTEEDVTAQAEINGFDSITAGVKTVTVTYNGIQSSFTVEIVSAELVSLEVTPPVKTEYRTNENFDSTGMVVTAVYSDGTNRDVTHQVQITGFDSSVTGTVDVSVLFAALSASFSVSIIDRVYILGDANGDGRITTKDSLSVLRYAIGLWKDVTEDQKAALDVDGNGKVTASDALKIQRYAIGLVKAFRKG